MYMHFARKFLEAVSKHDCKERVKYLEFFRKGWTFHGKGIIEKVRGIMLVFISNLKVIIKTLLQVCGII